MGSSTRNNGRAAVSSVTELASSPPLRDCLGWFARERAWINQQHLQVCRIPAPTFLEGQRADWMVEQLRGLGWDARIDRGGNVNATLESRGPLVALTAHLDTVLAPRHPEDIRVDADGTLRGPGVSDNGAGLAALLALARAWTTCSPIQDTAASVLLVANVGEEGEGNLSGMRFLCRQSPLAGRIRSFLVLDGPATDHITAHALASRRFEINFAGPGGHSWSDFGTANPVHALSRAVTSFIDSPPAQAAGARTSYNFGVVEGGSTVNSIPAEARTKVDIRSESTARIDELAGLLGSCVDSAVQAENERASAGRVSARVREIGFRPGGRLADDAPILRLVRAVDAHLGIRSHVDCASTDANIPLSMNLPALSIGAGGQGGGAHTSSEWFHPDGREAGLRRILLALAMLVSDAA
ncbi:MAG TPA: M20/M25/M40 family metallo-hydrolase [Bryobacteraceae bacterium]|nr:M20/M25/M40 family metallo-hydrolase [Bryobacteraceae bacterium]